ncbi:glycoside hydrolase family 32 protein [Chitinophaga sedimenti]|uniref:glycoside hydrolase family 32 protein n=1 Tax=Chitinophaga sedimenti TaxID=2033606 RepID=UPI00200355EB|nr:glycoside hydrolase family 32 protein [Chitinophaga sedimenti]MCK7554040.1 glycoside hydrolase family 32 protein [Chitinophaga sedimenti]
MKLLLTTLACAGTLSAAAADTTITVTKRYLNLPVSQQQGRSVMMYESNGKTLQRFKIRLSAKPEYWVFSDMSAYRGKRIRIRYEGDASALRLLYQDDRITGQDSLYREQRRPQYHFSTRRGWINDPNGMVFYEGEYHLFYQHNPFEREWENMSWGHAVSKDMIHWEELPVALHPDELGTMFSGSAVIDYDNTSGFGKPRKPAMVALYTVDNPDRQIQCLAYSLDKGRTWTKYPGNPLIDSKDKWNSKDTRDPRVFWYAPGKHWVMALNERDGHSIYTSTNLKEWTYQSHTTGFWECPDLFELSVAGKPNEKKWVMYGASNTYMIGSFDGKKFTPESGKHYFSSGSIYAAQTFSNIADRRIQIGWGRIAQRGMPFNNMMLLPTELTLRPTKDGIRLFSEPVKEVNQLFTPAGKWSNQTMRDADQQLAKFNNADALRIRTTIKLSHATDAGLSLFGQRLINYDMNFNMLNGMFYSPQDPTSMELTADIYLDRSSVEVFIDGGAYSYSFERRADDRNNEGFRFWGNNITVKELEVWTGKSIWP